MSSMLHVFCSLVNKILGDWVQVSHQVLRFKLKRSMITSAGHQRVLKLITVDALSRVLVMNPDIRFDVSLDRRWLGDVTFAAVPWEIEILCMIHVIIYGDIAVVVVTYAVMGIAALMSFCSQSQSGEAVLSWYECFYKSGGPTF